MDKRSSERNGVPPAFPPPEPQAASGRAADPFREDADKMRLAVERALQQSARNNRRVLSAALAPVVVGALRRSFWNLFKCGIARMNRFLVLTFSADGLRWHFEALRSGRTFEAVVREHSLVEPVTQVFLIHRSSGLMLAQVNRYAADEQDGDMVSSMLTAIQDFVHDSFRVHAEGRLEVIRVGNVSVLIEQGEYALLAGIVFQGEVPGDLRDTFRRALHQLHTMFAEPLENFKGDTTVFAAAAPVLERCLKLSMVKGEDRISPLTAILLAAPVVAGLVFGGLFVERTLRWRQYLGALEREPGIVVLKTGWHGGQRMIRGLRDPLALEPEGLLLAFGLATEDVHSEWVRYQALDEVLLLPRVRRMLELPAGVNMVVSDGVIVLDGVAPPGWKQAMSSRLRMIPGVKDIRMDALMETGAAQAQAWQRYVNRLENTDGIVVLAHGQHDQVYYITGLHDPLARDPERLLTEAALAGVQVDSRWVAYETDQPEFVLRRAHLHLQPPPSVSFVLDGRVLQAKGEASNAWIREAGLVARLLTGVDRLETSALVDTDMAAIEALIPLLEAPVFYYLADQQSLWPGQERTFGALLETIQQFSRVSRRIGHDAVLEIRGYAPAAAAGATAQAASEALAERFYQRLMQAGVDMERFRRRGMGRDTVDRERAAETRLRESHVSLKVLPDA